MQYVISQGEETTIIAALDARAQMTPDARFVTFLDEHVTFAAFVARAERAAAALAALGARRGSKVAVLLPNCLEFLDVWFGSALLGAALVPVNTGLKGDGLRYVLEHSEADVLVADAPLTAEVDAALVAGAGPLHRLVRGPADGAWQPWEQVYRGEHPAVQRAILSPGDLASVLYTSGTTGLPKGVMNCHNAFAVAGYEFTRNYVEVRDDDVLYTSLPLFHVNAQMLTTMGSIIAGRPMVLAPRFSASRFFDDLRAHNATVFNYIGAMLTMIFKQPARPGDADNPVRLTVGGAAPANLWPEFEKRFGLEIQEIYGLTETATFCVGSRPGAAQVGKLGTPVSWADVAVRARDGDSAPDGEPGEIVVRSRRPHALFQGYYKNPQATAAAMDGEWFRTGDRGRREPDGTFVFLDRIKDVIRRRGENISSYDVERIVNSHPAVAESAAVGVPSDLGEEEVLIVVVPRPGAPLDPGELVEYCEQHMAKFMVPSYVRLAEALPKTATQRVQKFALRKDGVAGAWCRERPVAADRSA
jgi:crotonobetaine/carnitine-CoA ligase